MNCPNCGAENEAGARFCVECGAPLETQVNLPSQPPEMDDRDDDRTIMSSFGRLAEEAKTVAVTQEQLSAAEAEVASAFERGPEPEVIPPTPRPIGGSGGDGGSFGGGNGGGGQNWMSRRNIIIAIVVLVVLCCCCSGLVGISVALSGEFDQYLETSLLTAIPFFV